MTHERNRRPLITGTITMFDSSDTQIRNHYILCVAYWYPGFDSHPGIDHTGDMIWNKRKPAYSVPGISSILQGIHCVTRSRYEGVDE